ncbi:uncharacterized protein LOC111694524 [Trichogramma pretiosum]|uniref:uncharacterized protein LOC111694524 n=1 Tax=Trichogramma pretiosum TaxID=7493 RepID=UPI000C71A310|nr:uncharacterized protein LOC111694524 [Trichogramma pretiosum]
MFKKLFTIIYLPEIPGLVELDKNYGETLIFLFHTTFYVTQPPINWEFAIQNLFELSFVLMMFSMYFILGNMQREIHDYTSMTVNFWDSITDSDQKEYFEKCEYIGRKVLMILSTYVLVALSFTGTMILFSLSVNNYFLLLEMIISFFSIIFTAFLTAHFGQIVINASDDIFYDCYFCGWYKFPSNTKPYIIMMMIRALSPCELKAGPSAVLTMNYENFSAVSYDQFHVQFNKLKPI